MGSIPKTVRCAKNNCSNVLGNKIYCVLQVSTWGVETFTLIKTLIETSGEIQWKMERSVANIYHLERIMNEEIPRRARMDDIIASITWLK